jgi:hypothetical protein
MQGAVADSTQRRLFCRMPRADLTAARHVVIIWPLPNLSATSGKDWELNMRYKIASVVLAVALMPSAAMAGERAGDAALGAVSGALVLGPIGAVGGAAIGYTAGPSISHSWGLHRSNSRRQVRRAARDSRPVPNQSPSKDHAAPQAVAPARSSNTATASSAPPVQPLE